MKKILLFLLPVVFVFGEAPQPHLQTLYRSLDPQSISQNLYPQYEEGQRALRDVL